MSRDSFHNAGVPHYCPTDTPAIRGPAEPDKPDPMTDERKASVRQAIRDYVRETFRTTDRVVFPVPVPLDPDPRFRRDAHPEVGLVYTIRPDRKKPERVYTDCGMVYSVYLVPVGRPARSPDGSKEFGLLRCNPFLLARYARVLNRHTESWRDWLARNHPGGIL